MATITIRKIDDDLMARLRSRAAEQNRSIEDEARAILHAALFVVPHSPRNLAEAIRARVGDNGGWELDIPSRQPITNPPEF